MSEMANPSDRCEECRALSRVRARLMKEIAALRVKVAKERGLVKALRDEIAAAKSQGARWLKG